MLYGEEIIVLDAAAEGGSPVNMNASTGAKYTRRMKSPGLVVGFGFDVTTTFNYDTQTAEGVLALYRYPAGGSGSKVLLAEMDLKDAMAAKEIGFCRVRNMVTNATPVSRGPAMFDMGDSLVVEVKVQATGGTYIAGAFQPFIWVTNRGENLENQGQVTDLTPAITPSY